MIYVWSFLKCLKMPDYKHFIGRIVAIHRDLIWQFFDRILCLWRAQLFKMVYGGLRRDGDIFSGGEGIIINFS